MINVAIMPLKAYISEPFPWTTSLSSEIPNDCHFNYTQCTTLLLSFFRNQSKTMPPDSSLLTATFDVHAIRFSYIPAKTEDDAKSYALHFPSSIFYSKKGIQQAITLARKQYNVSDFSSVVFTRFLGIVTNYITLWAVENQDDDTMFIGGWQPQMSFEWLLLKLVFRLCLSAYIVRYMWKHYYSYYPQLAKNLHRFGLENASSGSKFEIVIGDPTSIVILNPIVSALLVVDFWISVDFVGRVFNRIIQLAVIKDFLLAYLYLSRTLWFGYGSLSIMSYLLKRFDCARLFYGVDPTWTAIGIALVAGPMTLLQSRISFMVQFYNFIFTSISKNESEIEISIAVIFYTLLLGTLPVMFSFLPRESFYNGWKKLFSCTKMTWEPSSYLYNDTKNRWTLQFVFFTFRNADIITKGGSVYNLFQLDFKYKKHLGIGQCGADCYVKLKSGTGKWTCCRLSLLSCIDIQPPIQFITSKHLTAVGKIEIDKMSIKIIQGSNKSPWVL
ncbi:hypothetical protein THRCLA_00722 [Thraustotheca clavata]|uniref:Transmembrane protein n=1 Tax=Thraustotheca clavata TaxID=74557 RepID=A0A1W0AAR1_9STRA|nr:hypothetical protein THRCLA_00722 [Thraustotheca clavata]